MMQQKKHVSKIGIVCSYGIVPDKRLKTYCASVADYAMAHQLDTLLLTGGHTIANAPDTEARVAWGLIHPQLSDCSFLFEEQSISTLHNLLYAREILYTHNVSVDMVYIFCDRVRFMKVFCLSKIIFTKYAVRVVTFERKEPLFLYFLQIPFTILQCLGAVFPPVEKLLLQGRRAIRNSRD